MIPVYSADVCVCCAGGASSFFSLALITISGARQTRQTFEVFLFWTTHLGLLRCGWHFFSFFFFPPRLGAIRRLSKDTALAGLYYRSPPILYFLLFRSFVRWALVRILLDGERPPGERGGNIFWYIKGRPSFSSPFSLCPSQTQGGNHKTLARKKKKKFQFFRKAKRKLVGNSFWRTERNRS